MANMTNYLENKLVDFIFRGASFSPPATMYVALCTASISDTATGSTISEISGGNYARQSISSNSTNWSSTNADNSVASSGTIGTTTNNSSTITWAGVTWAGTITDVAICDSLTGGNVLFYGTLASSKTIVAGDSVSFGINTLSIQIDN